MKRLTLTLSLALVLTSPLLAASADLDVVVVAPVEATVGEMSWLARVYNNGPDPATDVTLRSNIYKGSVAVGDECRATIPSLAPGEQHEIRCTGTTTAEWPYNRTIRASVASATPDPSLSNNEYGTNFKVITNPDLFVNAYTNANTTPIDPGLPFGLVVNVGNLSYSEANGAVLSIHVPRAHGFVDLPENCSRIDDTSVRCSLPTVPPATIHEPNRSVTVTLGVFAPDDPSGADLLVRSSIETSQEDPQTINNEHELNALMFRTFWVTTTADSGEGSLRNAIENAAAACGVRDLCKIAFRIDDQSEPWQRIELQSPLPPVTGYDVRVDGTTQTRFFGDTNPAGPEVLLSGARLESSADGLVLDTICSTELAGLTINGFGGAGVKGAGTSDCGPVRVLPLHLIRDNYVGTDPTGTTAVANLRGIVIDFREPELGYSAAVYDISGNLVSGNTRSGIMSIAGTRTIRRNIIGINGRLDGPLPNGASGVYIAPDSDATDLSANYIGFNHHFGIAIASEAQLVTVHGNSIQANWQKGIDIGLDGVSPVTGPLAGMPGGVLRVPVITAAWWDSARGVTVIEGALPEPPRTIGRNSVNLYANDAPDPSGYGEGQYFLGEIFIGEDGSFRHEVDIDLRGKWLAATATLRHYVGFAKPITGHAFDQGFTSVSSEFGPVFEVQ